MRKEKIILSIFAAIALICLGIGYAALTDTLTGTASFTGTGVNANGDVNGDGVVDENGEIHGREHDLPYRDRMSNFIRKVKGLGDLGPEFTCFLSSDSIYEKLRLENNIVRVKKQNPLTLNRLREGYLKHAEGTEEVSDEVIKEYEGKFLEAINDDLNMPVAMSVVWDVIKNPVKSKKLQNLLLKFDEVLGLDLKYYQKQDNILPEEIKKLVKERNEARVNKNWAESDRIRDILIEKGYTVKDSKDGTIVEKL